MLDTEQDISENELTGVSLADMRAWVSENMKAKMEEFGVPHWRIDVFYEAETDSRYGLMCATADPGYEMASITIIWPRYERQSFKKFVADFEHELLHIAHSPFEIFINDVLAKTQDESEQSRIRTLFASCCEMTVRNLERLTYGIRQRAEAHQPEGVKQDATN